mmetsp:Transcript_19897/g.48365  ORF Transcript_19897/g.48365 Transcript_19897/m.48365 type:complete len:260 (-) Transcript_19897:49-828(-)
MLCHAQLGNGPHTRDVVYRRGVDPVNLDLRAPGLQVPARAGDRATSPKRRHKVRDLPLCLLPQLRPGGVVVGSRVRRVLVLVSLEPPLLGSQVVSGGQCALTGSWPWSELIVQLDQFSSHELQSIPLLRGHPSRNRHRQRVALSVRHHYQSQPGVATCRFDHLRSRYQLPSLLTMVDEVRSNSVFDGAERVVPLQLGVHLRVLQMLRHMLQPHKGSGILLIRQELQNIVIDANTVGFSVADTTTELVRINSFRYHLLVS